MVLNHTWGLLAHPDKEWETIRKEPCTVAYCYLSHVLLLAAIPPVSAYIGASQIGWQLGYGDPVRLTSESALQLAVLFYLALLAGVFIMGKAIHWMSTTYGAKSDFNKCVATAAYTATPLFLSGVMALYPVLWLNMLVGLAAVAYSIYLLYTGIPVVLGVSKERGFLFSSAVVSFGMVMLIGMLAVTVLLWGMGFAPAYTN